VFGSRRLLPPLPSFPLFPAPSLSSFPLPSSSLIMSDSTKPSPEAQTILDHLQSQSSLLRTSSFSVPTSQISIDQALSNVDQLKGKVVVITGAAGVGFGAHYSKKVAKYGSVVAILSLSSSLRRWQDWLDSCE
jgi:hypothetical protein